MTNAWENYHRRAAMRRHVQQRIERSPTGPLPWDDAIAEVFDDHHDLLMALHQTWSNQLAARVELALEVGSEDMVESVIRARRELTDRFPGLRRILDRHADDPALAHLRRVEHRLLAVAAGLASLDDPLDRAAVAGAWLVENTEIRVAQAS